MKVDLQNDQLWELLGEMPVADASPWFRTRVMARVRSLQDEPAPFWLGLRKFFAPAGALSAVAAVAMAAVFIMNPFNTSTAQTSEAEIYAALDAFMDSRPINSSVWGDN